MNETLEPAFQPTILVVDDTPDNLTLISQVLKGTYKVKAANRGEAGIRLAAADPAPDLILLDIMMPEMDGYEVLRRLKGYLTTRDIPVIFLTAKNQEEDEKLGLELGAVDYITKPISPAILLARVATHLQLRAARERLKEKGTALEIEVFRRTRELSTLQDVAGAALAAMAGFREGAAGSRRPRIQAFMRILARQLQHHPRYTAFLTPPTLELLARAAPLYDIGCVGIPDRILLKRGVRTPEEAVIMERHPLLGHAILLEAERHGGGTAPFPALAKEIASGHHENWDGSGYPSGLEGDAIPIPARLMALVAAYEALTCRKPHEAALSHPAAMEALQEGRGSAFDPDLLDALVQVQAEFQEAASKFQDSDEDLRQRQRYFSESLAIP